jgi:tRNA-splicing ligase RtcB
MVYLYGPSDELARTFTSQDDQLRKAIGKKDPGLMGDLATQFNKVTPITPEEDLALFREILEDHYGARIFGEHDLGTLKQVTSVLENGAEKFVLCADGHLGYAHPIGGVAAYRDRISLSGVGYDIGCGNLLVVTDADVDATCENIDVIMDDIVANISFGVGRKNSTRVEDDLFEWPVWGELEFLRPLKRLAEDQLGTVGSGNHYVDIFIDDLGRVCVGVHFGSRGLGHKTATHFLKAVGARDAMDAPPATLLADSDLGQQYRLAMALAGRYAERGREWVCQFVVKNILGASALDSVHNHHNYAWREEHGGEDFWVVRKGATPAFPGQRGFVGGSMGDDAYIVEGVATEGARRALYSTVHGAGRVMSRTAARGKKGKPGLVSREAMRAWLDERRVELRGGDLDEAPQAYRRLDQVLAYHAGTVNIVRTLRPIGVAMAGKDTFDPYKD